MSSLSAEQGGAVGVSAHSRLPRVLWGIHVLVTAVAVLSIATDGFHLWVDLRMLGRLERIALWIWVLATLGVPWIAGPQITGWLGRPRWVLRGVAAGSLIWGRRLLWPTYGVLACLLANTLWYVRLLWEGQVEWMIPMPLMMGLLLAIWVLLTREWMRRTRCGDAIVPCAPWTRAWAGTFVAVVLVILSGAFFLHSYTKQPSEPVDLAVVLGGRLESDGTPAASLAARVQAAIELYQGGQVRHVLLSGAIRPVRRGGRAYSETLAMKNLCLKAGVPENAITEDPVGVNTRATAANTRQFMAQRGYRTVVVCTSDFHLYRAVWCLGRLGIDAFAVPARPVLWRCADPLDTLRELAANGVYRLFPKYRPSMVEVMELKDPRLVVRKGAGKLELYDGAALLRVYSCISGGNQGHKEIEGDRRTPVGSYRVVYKNPRSQFHLSLGLDYPNRLDAQRGLADGRITQSQYQGILEALDSDLTREENQRKLWYTPLGGEIFIHGRGEGRPTTAGCVALSDADIEELFALVPLGTIVEILP